MLVNLAGVENYVDSNIQDITGVTPELTLWNFAATHNVKLLGTARWPGTVLAPFAHLQLGYKHISGTIVARSVTVTARSGRIVRP